MEKSMLNNFTNKRMAKECIDKLLEIDRMNPNGLEKINFILHTFLAGMRTQKKTKNEFLKLIK